MCYRYTTGPFNLFAPPLRIGLSYSWLQPGPITRFGLKGIIFVDLTGNDPVTFSLQSYCATKLRHKPIFSGTGRNRTYDAWLFRPTLYLLSYSPKILVLRPRFELGLTDRKSVGLNHWPNGAYKRKVPVFVHRNRKFSNTR